MKFQTSRTVCAFFFLTHWCIYYDVEAGKRFTNYVQYSRVYEKYSSVWFIWEVLRLIFAQGDNSSRDWSTMMCNRAANQLSSSNQLTVNRTNIPLPFLIATAREETTSPIGWYSTRSTEMPGLTSRERHSLRFGSELPTLTPWLRRLVYFVNYLVM